MSRKWILTLAAALACVIMAGCSSGPLGGG